LGYNGKDNKDLYAWEGGLARISISPATSGSNTELVSDGQAAVRAGPGASRGIIT